MGFEPQAAKPFGHVHWFPPAGPGFGPERSKAARVSRGGGTSLAWHVQQTKPPAAMVDRAQEKLQTFGFTEPVYAEPRDTAFGYSPWPHIINWIWDNVEPEERLAALADPAS